MSSTPPAAGPHVAIVMDGNGRWAESRGLPRTAGHLSGAVAARRIVVAAAEMRLSALTLYSFSSENWSRPEEEVRALMALAHERLMNERQTMIDNSIRFRRIGRREGLPEPVLEQLDGCEAATAHCTGMTLCLAMNYGARNEMVDAMRRLASQVQAGELSPQQIDSATIDAALDTAGLPDPDLLIRTAGQSRLSNFLLWQSSYAELLVTPTLWPDFTAADLHAALRELGNRRRTFGSVPAPVSGTAPVSG